MSSMSPRDTRATSCCRVISFPKRTKAHSPSTPIKSAPQEKREAQTLAEAKELASKIESTQLAVKAKAGGNGKLFGAVTNADVASAISTTLAVDVDKHKIEIKSQIKALGSYPVEIKLHRNVVAKATINVVSA